MSPEEKQKEGHISRKKIFGKGKYLEKAKEGNIWRRKIFCLRGERREGKYMERDNICRRKKENEDNI